VLRMQSPHYSAMGTLPHRQAGSPTGPLLIEIRHTDFDSCLVGLWRVLRGRHWPNGIEKLLKE
jgi:hypothetical protein